VLTRAAGYTWFEPADFLLKAVFSSKKWLQSGKKPSGHWYFLKEYAIIQCDFMNLSEDEA